VFKKEISRAPSASYTKIRPPLYINDKKEMGSFLLVENQHAVASAQEAILLTVKCGRLFIENRIGRVLILWKPGVFNNFTWTQRVCNKITAFCFKYCLCVGRLPRV
jgi:hypothetical protein